MSLKNLVADYAEYNLWANQRYVNWLSPKSDVLLNQEVASSFSSILKTLHHIWNTEEYWYSTIAQNDDFVNLYETTELNKGEIFEGIIKQSKATVDIAKSYTEEELGERIKVISPWFESHETRYEYLQHLSNHSSYHRGQIVTIGRSIGITDAPMSDFLFFKIFCVEK